MGKGYDERSSISANANGTRFRQQQSIAIGRRITSDSGNGEPTNTGLVNESHIRRTTRRERAKRGAEGTAKVYGK